MRRYSPWLADRPVVYGIFGALIWAVLFLGLDLYVSAKHHTPLLANATDRVSLIIGPIIGGLILWSKEARAKQRSAIIHAQRETIERLSRRD